MGVGDSPFEIACAWSAITAPQYVVGYRWKLSQITTNAVPFNPARRTYSHTMPGNARLGG